MYTKIILTIAITIFLSSSSFVKAQEERTLIYAEQAPPLTLNPLNIKDDASFRLSQLIFNSMVGINRQMNPIADLLRNLLPQETIIPNRVYTFNLRQNVRWHDGEPFTARDVKFTFDMLKQERTATNLRWIRNIVRNVEVVDTYTVRFTLYEPMGLLPLLENIGYINIIPRHRFADNQQFISETDDFGREWILGLGPYQFISWDNATQRIILQRNSKYHKGWGTLSTGEDRIDNIEMRVIKEPETAKHSLLIGKINLLPVVSPKYWEEIEHSQNVRLDKYNIRSFFYIAFNCDPRGTRFFNDKRVRQALTLAVDRWKMLSTIYGDRNVNTRDLMTGPYLPDEINPDYRPLGYDEHYGYNRTENINRARQLLREAGFDNGFTVELKAYIPDEECRRIVEWIKKDLAEIGITVTITPMDRDTWWKEVVEQRDFEMAFGQQTFHAHTDIVKTLFLKESPNNIGSYMNPEVEELSRRISGTYQPEEIVRLKNSLHQIIKEDCPYIFLFRLPLKAGYDRRLQIDIHPYWFFGFVNEWNYRR